jgi:hypothetical protein
MRHNLTREERFWHYVDKSGPTHPHTPDLGPCWLWTGVVNDKGYGTFNIRSALQQLREGGKRMVTAHRFAYEHAYKTDPGNLFVCHSCDNRKCVNPAHLFLGTNRDNVLDCMSKGRWKTPPRTATLPNHVPHRPIGVTNAMAKVTDEIVRTIRHRRASGATLRAIAQEFGISCAAAWKIANRKGWTHVE